MEFTGGAAARDCARGDDATATGESMRHELPVHPARTRSRERRSTRWGDRCGVAGDRMRSLARWRRTLRERAIVVDSNARIVGVDDDSPLARRSKKSTSIACSTIGNRRVEEVGHESDDDGDEPSTRSFFAREPPRGPRKRKNIFRPFTRGWGCRSPSAETVSQRAVDMKYLRCERGCIAMSHRHEVRKAASGLALRHIRRSSNSFHMDV